MSSYLDNLLKNYGIDPYTPPPEPQTEFSDLTNPNRQSSVNQIVGQSLAPQQTPPPTLPAQPPSNITITPQQKDQAKLSKTQLIPDDLDLPSDLRTDIRKNESLTNKEFLDFGNQLQSIYENQLNIKKQGLKQRQLIANKLPSMIRDMSREQFNLTIDALQTRKIAQRNLAQQVRKIDEINTQITNYSKRIDPDFFWNRRSPQAQSSIIEGLVGLAAGGVDPVALIKTLQSEINREIDVQKSNIGIDLDLLKEKRTGAIKMYSMFKEIYDDDLVIETAINSAYKEKASEELKRVAFLLEEGETQTNLMIGAEEIQKAGVEDRFKINQLMAQNYQENLANELKLRNEIQEKEEWEWKKLTDMIKIDREEEAQKFGQSKAEYEALKAQQDDERSRSYPLVKENKDNLIAETKGLSDEDKKYVSQFQDFGTLIDKSVRPELEKTLSDNRRSVEFYSKILKIAEYLNQPGALRVLKGLFPGKTRMLQRDLEGFKIALVGSLRIPLFGGGPLTEQEAEKGLQAININPKQLFGKDRQATINKIKLVIEGAKRKYTDSILRNMTGGGDKVISKVYKTGIEHEIKKLLALSENDMMNLFEKYGKK